MAMLIGKFHRLIGSKVFWIIFSALIIISFVWWSVPGMGKNNAGIPQRNAGELNGRDINHSEFGRMRSNERLISDLRNQNVSEDQLDQNAWNRIAALEAADKMGIRAIDTDVTSSITQLGLFQNDQGRFDPGQYRAVLANIRQRYGIRAAGFEQFIREEIVLQRLNSVVFNMVLVAPQEVKDIYQRYSKRYVVDFAELTPDWAAADAPDLSEEDLQSFYNDNRERFTIPEQVQVLYTRIPYLAFTNEVDITEERINEIYNANPDRFTREIEVEQPAEGTNAPIVLSVVTNLTFEEASVEITDAIKLQKSRSLAQDKGTEIWVNYQKTNDFAIVAQGLGLRVETSTYFSAQQPSIPGIDPVVPMQEFAFNLGGDPQDQVTDAMLGSNEVYVASLADRKPSRIPELEEVRDICTFRARQYYLGKRLTEKAAEFHQQISDKLSSGGSFSNLVAEAGLLSQRTPQFSAAGGELQGNPMGQALTRSVSYRDAGDLCDLEETPGGALLAYVHSAEEPDWAEYDNMREFIVGQLSQGRAQLVFNEFLEYLLKRGDFVSNFVSSDEPEAAEESGDDEAEPNA